MRLGIKFPAMSLSLLLSTKTCLKLAHIHSVKEFSDNLLIYIEKTFRLVCLRKFVVDDGCCGSVSGQEAKFRPE